MIPNISRGGGFRGLLNYALGGQKFNGEERRTDPRIIGGNMLGRDCRSLASEFKISRNLASSRTKKPVYHVSLSLAPGEQLNPEQWQAVAQKFIDRMGDKGRDRGDVGLSSEQNQYVLIHHPAAPGSTEKDHVHLIISRINFDGQTAPLRHDRHDAQQIALDLEREFGLEAREPVPPERKRRRQKRAERSPTRGQLAKAKREKRPWEELPPGTQEYLLRRQAEEKAAQAKAQAAKAANSAHHAETPHEKQTARDLLERMRQQQPPRRKREKGKGTDLEL